VGYTEIAGTKVILPQSCGNSSIRKASYYDLVDQHGIKIDRPPMSLAEDVHGHVHTNPASGSLVLILIGNSKWFNV
jgi:hypothetical protein